MIRSRAALTRLGVFVVFVLPLTVLGCGKSVGTLSGKITKGGSPLPGGLVNYVSADGKTRLSGEIKPEDGSYTIPGVPLGDGKIGVDNTNLQAISQPGAIDPLKNMKGPVPEGMQSKSSLGKYVPIDSKFKDPNTSGFTVTVKRGTNTGNDFEVK
jgi:hypothetical protein